MSRPFQCHIVDGRKEFLKSDVLHLGTLMLWEYLVTYLLVLAIVGGHIDGKYGGAILLVILKNIINLWNLRNYSNHCSIPICYVCQQNR